MAENFRLGDILTHPAGQLIYPGLSAVISAMGPGGARAAHALTTGIGMINALQQQQQDQQRRDRLSAALGDVLKTTETEPYQVAPAVPGAELPGGTADLSLPEVTGSREVPVFSPSQQRLGEALKDYPELGLKYATQAIAQREQPPEIVSPRGGGIYSVNARQGRLNELLAPPEKETKYQHFTRNLGDRIVSGYFEPTTGREVVTGESQIGAAPATPKAPQTELDIQEQKARTEAARARAEASRASAGYSRQRTEVQKIAADIAKDPKKAPTDRLSTELARALQGLRDARREGDEEQVDFWRPIVESLGEELKRRQQERTGRAQPRVETLPPAAQHKGEIYRDTQTGERVKSDGKNWNPIGHAGEY